MAFKFNTFSGIAMGLMLSSPVFAAVTITAPEEIVILAINDQEVNSGLFRTAQNHYKLDAGQASLTVRYQQFFKHSDGEHDIVKSGLVTIQAPNLIDGQNYSIVPVGVPKLYEAAKSYAEQPTIAIYDQNNQLVVQQTGANNEAKPWFSKRLFDFTKSDKKPTNQPAAVYATNPNATQGNTTAAATSYSTVTTNAVQSNTADQQLIKIWQGATKTERQRFMSWLAEQ